MPGFVGGDGGVGIGMMTVVGWVAVRLYRPPERHGREVNDEVRYIMTEQVMFSKASKAQSR